MKLTTASKQFSPCSSAVGVTEQLSYEHRLHHSWQYREFFGKSEVFRLSRCTVFRIRNSTSHYRLGITMKARGTSVERNRTKRQVRESIRHLSRSLGSYDYNVVVSGSRRMSFQYARELGRSIRDELSKAIEGK